MAQINRLLNLSYFPNECVSGLTSAELNRQVELHEMNDLVEQVMYEDSECPTLEELLALLPTAEGSSNELEAIVAQQYDATKIKSTKNQEVLAVRKLKEFFTSYSFNCDIDTCDVEYLAEKLKYFYATLRKEDKTFYAPTTLVCIRAGLYRYFSRVRQLNIIENVAFTRANLALKAVGRLFLKAGGRIEHFEAICKEDMEKLSSYFDRSTPTVLLHEVYFVLIYFFGQRGREWIRGLTVKSLLVEENPVCGTLIRLRTGLQKTLGAKLSSRAMSDKEAVIRAVGGSHCPVQAVKLYLEKRSTTVGLLEDAPLFLTPKKKMAFDAAWFTKTPLGVNSLGGMMKAISSAAGLSKEYTAHCIRPTVISDLHEAGFRLEQICKITGHKETKTVQRYLTHGKRKATEMANMSDALTGSLYGSTSKSDEPGQKLVAPGVGTPVIEVGTVSSNQHLVQQVIDVDSTNVSVAF